MRTFASMLRLSPALPLALAVLAVAPAFALDESPLPVDVAPAFPDLKWPDDLTGMDTGRIRDVRPLWIGGSGDGSGRLFLATQHGTIHVLGKGSAGGDRRMVLDIRDRVSFDPGVNEEGFMGLAFHPKFRENGELFVYYTASRAHDQRRRSIVSRFKMAKDDPDRVDPGSEQVLMSIDQPYWNHNGGTIVFGPDGFLYICLGDGGAADDPHMNAQNLRSLLGKILRIDVDRREGDRPYAIPADNPFAGQPRYARGEIWAYGLRNVWRLSFDRETGAAWAGDVGQDAWEEIDLIVRGGNYGWNLREGRHPFGPFGAGGAPALIDPVWEYDRSQGKSITGGSVYRGPGVPELTGYYLYADHVSGTVWGLKYDFDRREAVANRRIVPSGGAVITFGEADDGETYYSTMDGSGLQFVSRPAASRVTGQGGRPGIAAQRP